MKAQSAREKPSGSVQQSSSTVNQSKHHPFEISIIPHLQVMKGGLTPCQRCTGNSGSSRLQIVVATKPLRGVSCHHSSHSLASSNFDGSAYSNQPGCGESAIDRNTYELYLSRENDIPRSCFCQKTLQPRVPSSALTKSSLQSNERYVPKNGQARRRP